jgi:transcriptional regulator with XRE-family HTH domain
MARIREIFARNLKKHRRECGYSQEQLAEKADVSTHYIAMLEIARSFPSADALERIAGALSLEAYELLLVPLSPKEELEELRRTILAEVKETIETVIESSVEKSVEKAFAHHPHPAHYPPPCG